MTRWTVLSDPSAVAARAADVFVDAARRAIEERGTFFVAMSGGGTPKEVYPLLLEPERRDAVDWTRVEFFWGDERSVPPDDAESNFGVTYRMLLSRLPGVAPERMHRMQAEAPDVDAAAIAYEAELRLAFDARGNEPPRFDLVWLGMGPDGHTASLFPGTPALDETARWAVANHVEEKDTWRMTLTYPVLDAARLVLFVVTGADKVEPIRAIRAGGSGLPSERVAGDHVEWVIDAAAAGEGPGTG